MCVISLSGRLVHSKHKLSGLMYFQCIRHGLNTIMPCLNLKTNRQCVTTTIATYTRRTYDVPVTSHRTTDVVPWRDRSYATVVCPRNGDIYLAT